LFPARTRMSVAVRRAASNASATSAASHLIVAAARTAGAPIVTAASADPAAWTGPATDTERPDDTRRTFAGDLVSADEINEYEKIHKTAL